MSLKEANVAGFHYEARRALTFIETEVEGWEAWVGERDRRVRFNDHRLSVLQNKDLLRVGFTVIGIHLTPQSLRNS